MSILGVARHRPYKPANRERNISTMDAMPRTLDAGFMTDARNRMVDSQVRPNKVSDPRLLEAMRALPRERFVPDAQQALAYADQSVKLAPGRVMPQPMVVARLIQAAEARNGEKVLIVAAGTGYSAAVFAAFGCAVTALEEAPALLRHARAALGEFAPAVAVVEGPLSAGWPPGAPYDVILIEGAVPRMPDAIARQLKPETGRLLALIHEGEHAGYAITAEATPAGVSTRPLFDCLCPMLPGFATAPAFEF
jgi:protein-L-isoaspartate(D-aspartate) O-methyltransferase